MKFPKVYSPPVQYGDRRTEARWIEARWIEAWGTEAMGD